jgi:hypothetical protein
MPAHYEIGILLFVPSSLSARRSFFLQRIDTGLRVAQNPIQAPPDLFASFARVRISLDRRCLPTLQIHELNDGNPQNRLGIEAA